MADMTIRVEPTVIDQPAETPVLSVVVPCFNERLNVAPMIAKLDTALAGIAWEVIYVDDNSPDGTAQEVRRIAQFDGRVRCIRRIGRRGLASAVIEGALSSSASYVAVIDGDLQHDETRLPVMLSALQAGGYDLAVARPACGGGRQRGFVEPLAAYAVRRRDPAGAGVPAGSADRPDERLLHV